MDVSSSYTEKVKIINRYQVENYSDVIIRLESEKYSKVAKSGMYINLKSNDNSIKKHFQIMRVSKSGNWLEILCNSSTAEKIFGDSIKDNEELVLMSPRGNGFSLNHEKSIPLLIGEEAGIAPLVFLAEEIKKTTGQKPVIFFSSNNVFPFKYSPSRNIIKDFIPEVTASIDFLELMGFVSRLASKKYLPGCYNGYVYELAEEWLKSLALKKTKEIYIYACGKKVMLKNISLIAEKYNIDCQICILDHLGCNYDDCICLIDTQSKDKMIIEKICRDGPVFESKEVYYD